MILAVVALLIVIASFWYTNNLVRRIADDERVKARIWAEAVEKRAKLIRFTNTLFTEIKGEERKKAELYAEAFKELSNPFSTADINFVLKVLQANTTVPVILVNDNGQMSHRNLDSTRVNDTAYVRQQLEEMKQLYPPVVTKYYQQHVSYLYYKDSKVFTDIQVVFDSLMNSFKETSVLTAEVAAIFTDSSRTQVITKSEKIKQEDINTAEKLHSTIATLESQNTPLTVDLGDGHMYYIFYSQSDLLTKLKYYPYIQFGVIGLFLIIAYVLFSTARKAEQDQVWVGMSKETAHQLGTPLSSLMAWNEHLITLGVDESVVKEMQQDVKRLNTITDRFSKIGSQPAMESESVNQILEEAVDYLKRRTSRNVLYTLQLPEEQVVAPLSRALFEWVIENLCKNAVDAMEGKGHIEIVLRDVPEGLEIDITDSGKGIPKANFKTVFEPGYTTKSRGWGLGLSLCKRIIETYHKGKIFVLRSEQGKGTTFRIEMKRG